MNEIKIFENEEFGKIRTAGTSENPLFCLADICKAVELTNPSSVKSRLDKDDVQLIDLHALNYKMIGNSMATFVTESGFYEVLLFSTSAKVKPFRKWITHDILPSIRKTGQYNSFQIPKTFAEALRLAADQQEMIEEQQKQLEANATEILVLNDKVNEMQPKVTYYDQILSSRNTMLTTQIAKDYGYSARKFNKLLESLHIQYKLRGQWLLYAEYAGNGYTKSVSIPYEHNDGTYDTRTQSEWTQSGRLFLYEKLKANGILPMMER